MKINYNPSYIKNNVVVIPEDCKNRFKKNESALCEAAGGQWSHRQNGYVMSKTKAEIIQKMNNSGWTANYSIFKRGEFVSPDGEEMDYRGAKKCLTSNNL